MEEIEMIAHVAVAETEEKNIEYDIFKIGAELYVAKPANISKNGEEQVPEIYIEKTTEGWQHFSPSTDTDIPETIVSKLITAVSDYHQSNEDQKVPETISF